MSGRFRRRNPTEETQRNFNEHHPLTQLDDTIDFSKTFQNENELNSSISSPQRSSSPILDPTSPSKLTTNKIDENISEKSDKSDIYPQGNIPYVPNLKIDKDTTDKKKKLNKTPIKTSSSTDNKNDNEVKNMNLLESLENQNTNVNVDSDLSYSESNSSNNNSSGSDNEDNLKEKDRKKLEKKKRKELKNKLKYVGIKRNKEDEDEENEEDEAGDNDNDEDLSDVSDVSDVSITSIENELNNIENLSPKKRKKLIKKYKKKKLKKKLLKKKLLKKKLLKTEKNQRLLIKNYENTLKNYNNIKKFLSYFPINIFNYLLIKNFQLGYNLNEYTYSRLKTFSYYYPNLDLKELMSGYNLSLYINTLQSSIEKICCLYRPYIRIHAVNIDSGQYLRCLGDTQLSFIHSKPSLAKDYGCSVTWNETVTLDLDYADLVNEHSLLLFEIIDLKPTLSTGRTKRGLFNCFSSNNNDDERLKQKVASQSPIAWGYLLPIGLDGKLNVGVFNKIYNNDEKTSNTTTDVSNDNNIDNKKSNTVTFNLNSEGTEKDTPKTPSNALDTPLESNLKSNKESEKDSSKPTYSLEQKSISLRIQLYHYKRFDGIVGFLQRKSLQWPKLIDDYDKVIKNIDPSRIPSVYLQWRLLRHNPIRGGYLSMTTFPTKRKNIFDLSDEDYDEDYNIIDPTKKSKKKKKIKKRFNLNYILPSNQRKKPISRTPEQIKKLRTAVLKRLRNSNQPCFIPDKFLTRINVGPEGAMVVSFSNSGHLLAIASRSPVNYSPYSMTDITYNIIFYDTDTHEEVWTATSAHHGVIYDLKWSKNDRYLLSCSGDSTCKVWDLLALSSLLKAYVPPEEEVDEEEEEEEEEGKNDIPLTARSGKTVQTLTGSPFAKVLPPRVLYTLSLTAGAFAYCGVFQDFNTHLPSLANPNTPYDYYKWVEEFRILEESQVSRIIVSSADSKLRVFDKGALKGYIMIHDKDENGVPRSFTPHRGAVNSLTIDERSRYLISADSVGDILSWRLDANGWYQILRKFKKDTLESNSISRNIKKSGKMTDPNVTSFDNGSILTVAMHPQKMKGLMLVMSRHPSVLKVINMSTYKQQIACEGFQSINTYFVYEKPNLLSHSKFGEKISQAYSKDLTLDSFSTGVYYRASFSADGRYIICCIPSHGAKDLYQLQIWEVATGRAVISSLCDLVFPYPIRCISWHPSQHLIAISMAGPGAAVILYTAESDQEMDFFMQNNEGNQTMYMNQESTYNPLQTSVYTDQTLNLNKTGPFNFTKTQFTDFNSSTAFSDNETQPLLGTASFNKTNKSLLESNDERALRNLRAMSIISKLKASRAMNESQTLSDK